MSGVLEPRSRCTRNGGLCPLGHKFPALVPAPTFYFLLGALHTEVASPHPGTFHCRWASLSKGSSVACCHRSSEPCPDHLDSMPTSAHPGQKLGPQKADLVCAPGAFWLSVNPPRGASWQPSQLLGFKEVELKPSVVVARLQFQHSGRLREEHRKLESSLAK